MREKMYCDKKELGKISHVINKSCNVAVWSYEIYNAENRGKRSIAKWWVASDVKIYTLWNNFWKHRVDLHL